MRRSIQISLHQSIHISSLSVAVGRYAAGKKSKLYYTRGIMPKRGTSGGDRFRGLAPGQHSSEETSHL